MAKKKIKGLGDVIATVTEAIGIEPCEGCKQRQEKLNRFLPFGTKDLTPEQKDFLKSYFESDVTSEEIENKMIGIYFDVFNKKPFVPAGQGVYTNFRNKLKTLDYEN